MGTVDTFWNKGVGTWSYVRTFT